MPNYRILITVHISINLVTHFLRHHKTRKMRRRHHWHQTSLTWLSLSHWPELTLGLFVVPNAQSFQKYWIIWSVNMTELLEVPDSVEIKLYCLMQYRALGIARCCLFQLLLSELLPFIHPLLLQWEKLIKCHFLMHEVWVKYFRERSAEINHLEQPVHNNIITMVL